MSKTRKEKHRIQFKLSDNESIVNDDIDDKSNNDPNNGVGKNFIQHQWSKFRSSLKKNNHIDNECNKQKKKLIRYLSAEEPLMKNSIQIDDYERMLLEQHKKSNFHNNHHDSNRYDRNNNIDNDLDIDKYFKLPKSKVNNDKLWRIPYKFSNDCSNNDDIDDDDGDKNKLRINRFGEGIDDGCMIGLNLPEINEKHQFKTWDQLIKCSDEVLSKISNNTTTGSGRKINKHRHRRGSILQPCHVFLMPNPEATSMIINNNDKNNVLREWSSELMLDVRSGCGEELLDSDYRQNILTNVSIDDLSDCIYPELKLSLNLNGMLSDSEIRYIQVVSNRRRQSLVPPMFGAGGNDSMTFRRKSFAGGQLWSTDLERQQQRHYYLDKLALINPDHCQRQRFNSTASSMFSENMDQNDDNPQQNEQYFIKFDPDDDDQIIIFSNELTIIVRKYFNSIKSSEIINYFLNNGTNVMKSFTHIKGLLHFQNRITRLISTYILRFVNLKERVRSILFFIRVAKHLTNLNNWHSINLVIKSLQCPPIVRLKNTWRKITFKYAEDYCNFIQLSEDLDSGKQWLTYEMSIRCLPIFDDVIEMIKEQCGIIIVQIRQHRFHQSWQHYHNRIDDHRYVNWIVDEVKKVFKDCGQTHCGEQQITFERNSLISTDNHYLMVAGQNERRKQSITSAYTKTLAFWRQLFHRKTSLNDNNDGHMNNDLDQPHDKLYNPNDYGYDDDDDPHQTRLLKGSKNELKNVVRRRRHHHHHINYRRSSSLSSSFSNSNQNLNPNHVNKQTNVDRINNQSSKTMIVPCGKQFWSLAEYYKLRQSDRELIKQQIVRTMVKAQKNAFYVFEDRDEMIKNFLLNFDCDSMDTCMKRSRMIENHHHHHEHKHQQSIGDTPTPSAAAGATTTTINNDQSINHQTHQQPPPSTVETLKTIDKNVDCSSLKMNKIDNNRINDDQNDKLPILKPKQTNGKPKRRVMFSMD